MLTGNIVDSGNENLSFQEIAKKLAPKKKEFVHLLMNGRRVLPWEGHKKLVSDEPDEPNQRTKRWSCKKRKEYGPNHAFNWRRFLS